MIISPTVLINACYCNLLTSFLCVYNIAKAVWNKAKKDKTEAPTKEPTVAAEAPLLGPGAGAETSVVANAALMEAAAMRTAQV
ncbi:hypothetical protein JHK86_004591 [Glycine max]|nr:hypothetical protein JHK86_004591 [Glycine max]